MPSLFILPDMSKQNYKKRFTSFFRSDTPLVSKRVRIILSSPEDSEKLANAIRDQRSGKKDTSFMLSDEVTAQFAQEK